jgi:hypothetical protein
MRFLAFIPRALLATARLLVLAWLSASDAGVRESIILKMSVLDLD